MASTAAAGRGISFGAIALESSGLLCPLLEDPTRVLPIDVADERRQDAVAEEFLHPFGQRGDDVRRDGKRHVLDLSHPGLAVLRRDSEPDTAAAVRATAMQCRTKEDD